MMYQILTLITPLITAPYVSRVLGVENIGIYSYTLSIQHYFMIAAALGTNAYGQREIARIRNDENKRSLLFWEIELLSVITTLTSLVCWSSVVLTNTELRVYFLILSANILAVLFDISWFYAGLEHFEHTVLRNSLFKIAGIIAIFTFVKTDKDLLVYLGIFVLSNLLGNISMWAHLPKYLVKINWKDVKITRHFKETLIYFIPTVATSVYSVLDRTLIGLITQNNAQNGYYEQSTKIISMANQVCFGALNAVTGARNSYLFAENKHDEIKRKIDQSIDYILFMGIGLCFGISAVASRFVPWFFGDGYDAVVNLLYIFSPIVFIIGVSNCLGANYYTPAGYRIRSSMFLIVGSIVNLILNCILIPKFDSYGAAVASVIAELVITILYMKNCDKYLTYRQLFLHGWRKVIAGVVMFVVIYAIDSTLTANTLAVFLDVFVGIVTYILVLFLTKDSIPALGIKILKERLKKFRSTRI